MPGVRRFARGKTYTQKAVISEVMNLIMQEIRCPYCGKVLLEANGEVKKRCPKCKEWVHVVVTSKGIISLAEKIEDTEIEMILTEEDFRD